MKQIRKTYLSIGAMLSACLMVSPSMANVRIRSQSVDSARELVGWTDKINLFGKGGYYGTFAITPEYTGSFNGKRIAKSLFGNAVSFTDVDSGSCATDCFDNNQTAFFNVSGSKVANRGANDLLADYFGLPTDFASTVTLKPKIQNFILDFDAYWGLDEIACGLWFRIHAPLVYANWKLNLSEDVTAAGVNSYVAGYFAPTTVTRANMVTDFTSYLKGATPNLGSVVSFQPLQNQIIPAFTNTADCNTDCGKVNSGSLHKTRLSDIQAVLGWNFWQDEDYHVGLGIRAAAPTGTRITSKYLFEPQIGNGHHWEVGGMFTSHYTFWRNADDSRAWGLYVDLNLTHLFGTNQCRTFDLCGRGDNSKYMLAEALGLPIVDGLTGNPAAGTPGSGYTAPTEVFQNLFTPVANISTASVNVSIPVQTDLTVLFNYRHCDYSWDFGYNFWATSCEKIKPCINSNRLFFGNNVYALKGDASVYGFAAEATSPSTIVNVPLSATESLATIHSGTNLALFGSSAVELDNPGIDNPQFAYAQGAVTPNTVNYDTVNQTRTSIQPVLLGADDINYASARTSGISHKIFTHFSHTWADRCYQPYLGIGAKVEFANHSSGCSTATSATDCALSCQQTCVSCHQASISEWGIWLKGGLSFN